MAENSLGYTQEERLQAIAYFARARVIADDIVNRYSAIIAPSATDEAPLGLWHMGSYAFNITRTVSAFYQT